MPHEGWVDDDGHHHHTPLWHPEGDTIVELHHEVSRPRRTSILRGSELLARSRPLAGSTCGKVRLPHPDDRAILLVAHAQIFNGYHQLGMFRLIDLVEFDCLASRYALDLPAIRARFRACGWQDRYLAFLGLARRLLGSPELAGHPMTTSEPASRPAASYGCKGGRPCARFTSAPAGRCGL